MRLFRRWLRTPEVLRWWGDAEEQEALLQEDLDQPAMVMRIVSFAGRPFAYAQDYEVHVWHPRQRREAAQQPLRVAGALPVLLRFAIEVTPRKPHYKPPLDPLHYTAY